MPANIVRTPREERLWREAKEAAEREGHAGDYAYITGTYERLRSRVGGAKGKDAYRERMRTGETGRLVLKAQLREQGVAMNPQDRDKMADALMRENGVIDPETEEPQGESDNPQPGMVRRYDKHGRRTRAVINPQAHERSMVYSRRGERSPEAQAELRRRGTEVPSDGVMGQRVYDYLRQNYPKDTLDWVIGQDWHFHPKMQLSRIHMERRPGGRDMEKVESMTEAVRAGKRFEPIVLCAGRDGPHVADGYHRLLAYRRAGLKTIAAYMADGGPTDVLPEMHRRKLNKSLGDPPTVLRAPERYKGDIDLFLAGSCTERKWRHEVEMEIERAGVHAIIADPERDDFPDEGAKEYGAQVAWEREYLGRARVVAFWLDASKPTSYASRVEIGAAVARDQKIVLGMSPDFPGRPYIETYAGVKAHTDLMGFTGAIIATLGGGRKVEKSARNTDGRYIRPRGAAHRRRKGWNPNPRVALRSRPHGSAMPGEAGHTLASPMAESSMQVMHAITASKRRDPREGDWGFDPLKNLPGNTTEPRPIGKPSVFVYKSDPQIQQALSDYKALLEDGKRPSTATHLLSQRFPWVLEYDTPRGRDWWAAVRRSDLPYPPAFDLEIDPDDNGRPRPRKAVFWREDLANLGQGIASQTGSGGAGR